MNDNKPQGRDDPKGCSNGDVGRDRRGGTYGGNTPPGTPDELVIQPRDPHQSAQPGAEVRGESLDFLDELPEGLRHGRKGPMNKTMGRRPAQD